MLGSMPYIIYMTDSRPRGESLQETYRRLERLSANLKKKIEEPVRKTHQTEAKSISKQEYERYKQILFPEKYRQKKREEEERQEGRKRQVIGQIISRESLVDTKGTQV